MHTLITRSVLVAASCLSINLWAGTDSGFYAGGSLGQSSAKVKYNNLTVVNDDDTAYKILAGFNFGVIPLIDLAVEADYRDFGKFEVGNTGVTSGITSFDVFGLAGFNFGPAGVFAKLGYCKGNVDNIGNYFDSSESFTAYGIGAKLDLPVLVLRAEYEKFDLDNFDNLSMLSVGATFTF